jgi:PAS domain S-box-containing protein
MFPCIANPRILVSAPHLVVDQHASVEALLKTFSHAGASVVGEVQGLASLAARSLGASIAVIGYLEGERLSYPVTVGIEQFTDDQLGQALVDCVLHERDVLVLPDLRADLRFARSPLVTGPAAVRFLAAAPIVAASGRKIGVLSVMDQRPRMVPTEDADALRVLARQVLAQLELAHAREMLECIFRQSGEGIVVVNENGAPQIVNAEARRQRGSDDADALARDAWLLEGGDERIPVEETLLYRAAHGERIKNEHWQVSGSSGETRWLSGSALPLRHPNGAPAGAILLTRDETERVRMQQALQNEASFRDQLLAIVGHDLRTPLSGVLMGARILQAHRTLAPPDRSAVDRIIRQAERMNRMVHDLLDYSRLRVGQRLTVVHARCDLAAIAAEVVAAMSVSEPERAVRLVVHGDARGEWDTDRLSQVLSNLIGNALAHGSPDSPVTVRVEPRAEEVLVSVHNEGTPIPPDAIGHLFEPFWRGGARLEKRTSGGLGLGLFIVQEIVRAHGGTLGVRSSRSEGTTFSIALPRVPRSGH